LLEGRTRHDQLVVRLVAAGIELDRALVELDRPAQLTPGVRVEQVAVVVQHPRVRAVGDRALVQRLRRQKVRLVAERLVALEQLLLLHLETTFHGRSSQGRRPWRRSAGRRRPGRAVSGPPGPVRYGRSSNTPTRIVVADSASGRTREEGSSGASADPITTAWIHVSSRLHLRARRPGCTRPRSPRR